MISSTSDLIEFVRLIERVGQSKFELSSMFNPAVELYPFGLTQIAI